MNETDPRAVPPASTATAGTGADANTDAAGVGANAATHGTIGLAGVGLMGHGIATSLLRHGRRVRLLEHAGNQPLDALLASGATTATTPRELAAGSDVLLVCVTGSPQVEAVLTGADGAVGGLRPGALVVDCSTAIPASTLRMAAAVRAAGARFVDAAMTRTPREAAQGRLNLLVGGDAADLAAVRPVLDCIAESVTHAGPVGAGHRLKLLHNYVSLGTVALIAEAAACAQRAGIDAAMFVEVLARGGGGGVALERLRPFLENGDPSALRFTLANAAKDLGYYRAMAGELDAAQAIADGVGQTLERSAQALGAEALVPQLARWLADGGAGGG